MIWENGIETCIISYKKRIASPGLIQDSGCSGLVHWDDPEGWYEEGSEIWSPIPFTKPRASFPFLLPPIVPSSVLFLSHIPRNFHHCILFCLEIWTYSSNAQHNKQYFRDLHCHLIRPATVVANLPNGEMLPVPWHSLQPRSHYPRHSRFETKP